MSNMTFPEGGVNGASPGTRELSRIEPVSSVPQFSSPLPMVPDLGIETPTVPVPSTVAKEQYQDIPAWTYRKFQLTDLFYSKVGISATTALSAFSIPSVLNPPFVQEKSDNPIEINKPSFTVLYCISLVVFVFMMVVPVI